MDKWTFAQKAAFRFFVLFFGLLIFPFPFTIIPGIEGLFSFYTDFQKWQVNLVGYYVFGIEESIISQQTGSGDHTFAWIWNFIALSLGITGMIIWSALDRSKENYRRFATWFHVLISYYLAFFLFIYGIIKLFYLQFSPPPLTRLFETYGQSSPMRLMWTFMGYSETYVIFAGLSESVAAILLLFRRTRTLGALIAMGVMLNVFMMNMSYDVPVKLFSFQLFMIGAYLSALDYQRLLNVFILNRPAAPVAENPITGKSRIVLISVQVVFAMFVIFSQISSGISGRGTYGKNRPKSVLYGVYKVDDLIMNGDTVPPLATDPDRWQWMIFDRPENAEVITMTDNMYRFGTKIDTVSHTINFSYPQDTINVHPFTYIDHPEHFELSGILEGDTLHVTFDKYDLNSFSLLNRGFHWVNEYPYNLYNYSN